MTDEERQERVTALLNEIGPGDPAAPGSLVTGWALVVEWMAPDGTKWLSRARAPMTTAWGADGLHHEAIYGKWGEE